ncbi:MAG: phosphoesterase [Clostridia bacterium]
MKYHYDLHIHSALSPCAEKDMTPVTIVGQAKLSGLDFVAVSDHNSIKNVEVAIAAGEAYGILVVPAMELQTSEDIHLLCLFPTFDKLRAFYDSISFSTMKNRAEIFGEQQILDEDDNIVGFEDTMLLDSAKISSEQVPKLASKFDGVAVPAHIDREANSMLQILGAITSEFKSVELSTKASSEDLRYWSEKFRVLVDSDSHMLETMSTKGEVELPNCSIDALLDYIKGK